MAGDRRYFGGHLPAQVGRYHHPPAEESILPQGRDDGDHRRPPPRLLPRSRFGSESGGLGGDRQVGGTHRHPDRWSGGLLLDSQRKAIC